jgi:hypothetical protein
MKCPKCGASCECGLLIMNNSFSFSWEASDNPNDTSGIARISVGDQYVEVDMSSFSHANKLIGIIEKVCYLERQKTIDSSINNITNILNKQRYNLKD